MSYDELLRGRILRAVHERAGVTEKKMFGGVAYMLDGRMFCGVMKDRLMVRLGPEGSAKAVEDAQVHRIEMGGRTMKGYIVVEAEAVRTDKMVERWVKRGMDFVVGMEAKGKK